MVATTGAQIAFDGFRLTPWGLRLTSKGNMQLISGG
jgi:hypothetical protein